MKRCALLFSFALFFLLPKSVAAADCRFVLGFATLRALIGHDIVGECLENEHHNEIGDSVQQTTGGLMVWRKADNRTAFTDGYRTWINGPNGLVQRLNTERFSWEHDYAPGGGIAPPTPTPVPTPSPESIRKIEQAIAALPLVQRDPNFAREFQRLARVSQPVFWALLEQVGSTEFYVADYIAEIAEVDEATALQIVRMPFMGTPTQGADDAVILHASRLARSDLPSLQRILSHPRLRGGITDDHITTFVLLVLELSRPDAAAAIQALPWVQDGVGRRPNSHSYSISEDPIVLEEGTILDLVRIAQLSQEAVKALALKPWLQDGPSKSESQVIDTLYGIARGDIVSVLQLVSMPFLETSVTADDASILDALDDVLWDSPKEERGLRELLAHPTLRGGITDNQRATVELLAISIRIPAIAAALDTLPWVQDGISESEERAVAVLHEASRGTQQLLPALVRKSWMRDGLTEDEYSVLLSLPILYRDVTPGGSDPLALRLLSMPFMDTVDGADAAALAVLALFISLPDQSKLQRVLSHPTLRDGIKDEHTALISVLHTVDRRAPELAETLLDPGQVVVARRTLSFSELGEVTLAVISASRETSSNNMDFLEHAVRNQVEFMGAPLPKSYVGLWVHDRGGGGGGASGILHVGSPDRPDIVAHEVAHVYWPFPPSWIAEGAATFLERIAENVRVGTPVAAPNDGKCAYADTLSDHDKLVHERSRRGEHGYLGLCPYNLGAGLFVDLYRSLGDEAFRQSFRRLFEKLSYSHSHFIFECTGIEKGVCYVKAAFVTDAPPEHAAIAEPIINRWYYGLDHSPQ